MASSPALPRPADAWPLFDPYRPDAPAVRTSEGFWTQGHVLARAEALARRLPDRSHAALYCESRAHFLAALLAAWRAGQTAVFPGDQTQHGVRQLGQRFDGLYALAERGCTLDLPDPVYVDDVEADGPAPEAVPSLAGDHLAVRIFTSGSTGAPAMNDKTWAMLAACGKTIPSMLTLDWLARAQVVATVPSQHMYGFETTILYALQGGAYVHAGRPMYPRDIAGALGELPAPRVLVSTPTHLRALVESPVALPDIDHAISATAPLGPNLAAAVEKRLGCPVREIYGFTEAGSVAGRRTLDGDTWTVREDYRAEPDGGAGTPVVTCPAIGFQVPFPDLVEVVDGAHIRLKGRAEDVVNVAGKRASLSGLSAQLLEIDGVLDAAVVQPPGARDGGEVGRLVAFAVAPGWRREELRAAIRGRLDPAFVPRRLVLLDALPRTAAGKLPRAELDRLVREHLGPRASGARMSAPGPSGAPAATRIEVAPDDPCLAGHFPDRPVVPAAVLLDRLAAWVADAYAVEVTGVQRARIQAALQPDTAWDVRAEPAGDRTIRVTCTHDGRQTMTATFAVQGVRA
jgi:acyl-coenzyme A synthetase/AMP-(fatty) acid ligase/3-hydroxymyristoyl/3-hydroxydecanoyl-(acyl carrier protein) dehydratase